MPNYSISKEKCHKFRRVEKQVGAQTFLRNPKNNVICKRLEKQNVMLKWKLVEMIESKQSNGLQSIWSKH